MHNSDVQLSIAFNRYHYSDEELIALYQAIIKPRLIEEKMLVLLRQGKISKWFSGIGQEGVAVGSTLALEKNEFIFPMHRNLGVFTARNLPLKRLFTQFQGKPSGYTKGRDRSFHFGAPDHHIVGMISHLGPQLSLADGVALAHRLNQEKKVVLVFCGDGATSEGEFHEALNVAAVWDLPVIFLIENNGYGLSTPNNEQFRCAQIADKGLGYGMEAHTIQGNNILEVYHHINQIADQIRLEPRPVLLEAMTFRMRGHEEASGTKYVPPQLLEEWGLKDPVANYELFLLQSGIINSRMVADLKDAIKQEINQALEEAFAEPLPPASTETEMGDVYAPNPHPPIQPGENTSKLRFIDSIKLGLQQSMEKYPRSVLMGQDVAEYGGVFKVTDGFVEQFGKERVRNTPLCESAILGAGLGLSIAGYKAIVEMQFADFVTCGFNQIVNNLAKVHYRWGQNADVVIRMPTGGGVAAGPFHSQSNEAWFFHTPGLKLVYPSNPYDAKGLIAAAIEDPNPVLYFEHKYLYRSMEERVPDDYYTCPLGKARLIQEGEDLSVITYGMGVHWAQKMVEEHSWEGRVEILDLRSLLPWDQEAVQNTVFKTGKVLVLHEDSLTGGIGAEISAWISEHLFQYLDAPVVRVAGLDTPIPFSPPLENNYLASKRIGEKMEFLLKF